MELVDQVRAVVAEAVGPASFSGVVRVDLGGETITSAAGFAHRALEIPNTDDTRFALASVTKGFTALVVASLIADDRLAMTTPVRDVLGTDLPLIDDAVTVEHLLTHRSGIGDYLDESAVGDITDHVMPVPVHRLATSEDYLALLGGHPQVAPPGQRFAYCNSGFVVLAVVAERVAGVPFADLVDQRVLAPAGMGDSGFFRSDELPARTALGYLHVDGLRTNVLHLPVRGSGDGGMYATVGDLHRLWAAMFAGRLVPLDLVGALVEPISDVPEESKRYGRGFWLAAEGPAVLLEGYDAGVSCRTCHDPSRDLTWTVVSNTSDGAWPVARALATALA